MKKLVMILALIVMSGCFMAQIQTNATSQPVECVIGSDCNTKWEKAVYWVSTNSYWKIETQTDCLIITKGWNEHAEPGKGTFGVPSELAYKVNKVPVDKSTYKIIMEVWCNDSFSGCGKTPSTAVQDFNNYIQGKLFLDKSGSN